MGTTPSHCNINQDTFTVNINKLVNIKQPTFDRLKIDIQQRFDVQIFNEVLASVHHSIKEYSNDNDQQNTLWLSSYLNKVKIQLGLMILGTMALIIGYFLVTIGLSLWIAAVWSIGLIGILISIICAICYFTIRCKLTALKRLYGDNIRHNVQNALNLLNKKYMSRVSFDIDALTGTGFVEFDFHCNLAVRIKLTLQIQNVLYQNQNQNQNQNNSQVLVKLADGSMVVGKVIDPLNNNQNTSYTAPVVEGNGTKSNGYTKPLVSSTITMK